MKVAVATITVITNPDASAADVTEGFIVCEELNHNVETVSNRIDNQAFAFHNVTGRKWRIMVPKYLSGSSLAGLSSGAQPSPSYKVGDIIYAARLDMPVVIANMNKGGPYASEGLVNTHPTVAKTPGWVQLVPSEYSLAAHYYVSSTTKKTLDTSYFAAEEAIFWVDLNVDGRTRAAGSGGTTTTTSNVWL